METKKQTINWFLGIDISSTTLDVSILTPSNEKELIHQRFSNDVTGFKEILSWLKSSGVKVKQSWFCMEHTGIYGLELCCFLSKKKLSYTMYSPLHIKRMMGIVRGKNDKADSRMIAQFAYLYRDRLKPSEMPSKTLISLRILINHRQSLVKRKSELKREIHKMNRMEPIVNVNFVTRCIKREMEWLEAEIEKAEQEMNELINQDELVKTNFDLLNSVPGIGLVVASSFLVQTRNFESFENGRQLACYAGAAPFEYQSGSSIRGKTKIHPIANRQLKTLLTNSAYAALRYDPEIKKYYERKTAEGKAPMSVINAIRCKQIYRMFSVVKRGTPFVKSSEG
ncbi:MAG: IS110 family transposase [Cyclobacteriaceae bacterium]|nr:IS110 family transposase [Cyclobacteriaceae bacterium]